MRVFKPDLYAILSLLCFVISQCFPRFLCKDWWPLTITHTYLIVIVFQHLLFLTIHILESGADIDFHSKTHITGITLTAPGLLPWKGRIRKVTKFEGESSGFWGKGDLGAIGPFSNSKNNLRCAWSCDVSMTLKKKNPTENRKNKKKKNVIRISMNYRWPQKK